jgi:NADPH:quinone reductase-like Zn-dependent oxidoreductase
MPLSRSNLSPPATHGALCLSPGWPPRIEWATRNGELAQGRLGRESVRIRVEATSINPIDVKRAKGYGQRLLAFKGAGRFPLVLGNDVVGVITEVGRDVKRFARGDRVVGVKPPSRQGTHAEAVDVSADHVLFASMDASAESLAVLPYSFITMWLALQQAGIVAPFQKGMRVLVHGGSGALGLLAVQVLSEAGAIVTATGGGERLQQMRDVGAAKVIDRAALSWKALRHSFDATLNFASWEDEKSLLACLRPTALGHATTVHPLLGNADQFGVLRGLWRSWRAYRLMRSELPKGCKHYGWTTFRPDASALQVLAGWLSRPSSQQLWLPVGLVTPMNQPGPAFEHVASRSPGRTVLSSLLMTAESPLSA